MSMDTLEERFLIYTALAILCCTASAFLGAAVGMYTFMQIAAVIEVTYWLGSPSRTKGARGLQLN